MREINRKIVSALIFSRDNKIFMGMKDPTKGGVYSDCWHIPGGGVDEGEELITALNREVLEETGIDTSSIVAELIDDEMTGTSEKVLKDTREKVICHMQFNTYKIQLQEDAAEISINLSDDLVEYKWVDLESIKDLKLTPPSVELFTKLGFL